MGLLKGGINEVIATTRFNAAPMGIHYREGIASMVLFSGSNTAENIERDGWVVANFVQDPVLYVRTAFEDLPQNSFIEEAVSTKTITRLAGADAWAAFTATIVRRTNESMMVRLNAGKRDYRRGCHTSGEPGLQQSLSMRPYMSRDSRKIRIRN